MRKAVFFVIAATLVMGLGFGVGYWLAQSRDDDGTAAALSSGTTENGEEPICSEGYAVSIPVVDFGKMREGQAFCQWVEFTHPGTGDVRIGTIKTSCPCLSVHAPKRIIPKGENGRLRLDLHSLSAHGNRKWKYFVEILEPEKAMVVGRVDARIKRVPAEIMVDVESLRFGSVVERKTSSFKFYNLTKRPIRIKVFDDGGLTVAPIPNGGTVAPGSHVEVTVIADSARFKDRPLHGKLKLSTSLPLHEVVVIPFDGRLKK